MKLKAICSGVIITAAIFLPCLATAATSISIPQALAGCTAAGFQLSADKTPIQSELKKQTSLIGMAYLNYIYQNDIKNQHFCESMLLMNSQIPAGTDNPYVKLFDKDLATNTMAKLADVQLAFDYSIARTNPPLEKMQKSVDKLQALVKN